MPKEVLAIGLTLFVHIVGLVALIWALLLNEEERPDWRSWWPGGDEDAPLDPSPSPPRGGALPLDDARPSAVRLREPVRLADVHRRPARRPVHTPERAPEREPARGQGRAVGARRLRRAGSGPGPANLDV